ncbi:MAG TPA: helix-turn-helix domain-containing protein [Ktedonobacterales bacterium]|jgi:hypothetical protein
MPTPYRLTLSAAQRQDLLDLRSHAPLAYVRERAAVIVAVGDGASLRAAGRTAGLTRHTAECVSGWIHRYLAEGRSGLRIRKGRGRKPASFPAAASRRAGGAATPGRPTA